MSYAKNKVREKRRPQIQQSNTKEIIDSNLQNEDKRVIQQVNRNDKPGNNLAHRSQKLNKNKTDAQKKKQDSGEHIERQQQFGEERANAKSNDLIQIDSSVNRQKNEANVEQNMAKQQSINQQQSKSRQINYSQLLRKYQQLAGKPIKSARMNKAKINQNINEQQRPQVDKEQKQKTSAFSLEKNRIQVQKKLNESIEKLKKNVSEPKSKQNQQIKVGSQQKKQISNIANKSRIKFLAQKQYKLADQNNQQRRNRELLQIQGKLNGQKLKTSASLPKLQTFEPTKQITSLISQRQQNKHKRSTSLASTKYKQQSKVDSLGNNKVNNNQKQQQMNKIQFSLTNLRQKIQELKHGKEIHEIKGTHRNIKTGYILGNTQKHNNLKNNLGLSTISMISSVSDSPIKKKNFVKEGTEPDKIQDPKIQNQAKQDKQIQQKPNIVRTNSEKVINQRNQQIETNQNNNQISKLAQQKGKLEQIAEDIQNENIEKQEQLKQHKNKNKNLQISVLSKRQKIIALQAHINKIQQTDQQSEQQNETNRIFPDKSIESMQTVKKGQDKTNETNKSQIKKLQEQKQIKLQKFKEDQQNLKKEIKKIEDNMLEQQKKFMKLKGQEMLIKSQELHEKQVSLQARNKKLASQLISKTKQLEQIIKEQKQKSEKYQKQLEEQMAKNGEVSRQLRKQEQLQELLLQQIQKIKQERQRKRARNQEEKNKEKLRLIQEIKQLQEAQNQILMQYQRDSQSASSMFEAIRMKNIELENQIRQKKKEKQKQQYQNQSPEEVQPANSSPEIIK